MEDFDDFCQDRPAGTRHLAVVLNLATPEQLDTAVRVLGASYLDEIMKEAIAWLREHMDSAVRIYHVGPTQFAWIVPEDGDEQAMLGRLRCMLSNHASSGSGRFVTTATFGIAPFFTGKTACLD